MQAEVKMVDTYSDLSVAEPFLFDSGSAQSFPAADATATINGNDGIGSKRHAACDECRQRKLKCSGETSGCTRCVKMSIACRYSIQKQMGRPRKKQKTENERNNRTPPPLSYQQTVTQQEELRTPSPEYASFTHQPTAEPPIDPSLSAVNQERTNFTNICNGPMAQTIRDSKGSQVFEAQVAHFGQVQPENGEQSYSGSTMAFYPRDITHWPDFSTLSSLPMPVQESAESVESSSYYMSGHTASADGTSLYDPDANPAALDILPLTPACPCLPNLYLTLSTLSTATSFPVSKHTIETLLAAQRTAHSVVYCPVCPQKFHTGSQNLMLSCTLFNVLADHWHRIRRTTAEDLRKGFGVINGSSEVTVTGNASFMSTREGQSWRKFSHDLVRAYVFGDQPIPEAPSSSRSDAASPFPSIPTKNDTKTKNSVPQCHTLVFLIEALGRRQRQWHNVDTPTDEFPDHCKSGYYHKHDHVHDPSQTQGQEASNGNGVSNNIVRTAAGPTSRGGDRTNAISSDKEAISGLDTQSTRDEEPEHKRRVEEDHMVCLMIIKHCMDIVRSLEEDK